MFKKGLIFQKVDLLRIMNFHNSEIMEDSKTEQKLYQTNGWVHEALVEL